MFARMLTPAYLAAVILILRQNIACPAVIGLLITGGILINSHAPPKISRDYRALFVRQQGITDEKGFYFPASNLWMYKFYVQDLHRKAAFPFHPLTRCGYRAALEKQKVVVWSNIGYYGYWSGLDTIIVDDLALADPLLSKLPAVPGWFIGHFQRAIPEGYLESLRSGSNIIADPSIRGLYEDIRLVSQAPLLDPRRIGAIIRLNFRRSGL